MAVAGGACLLATAHRPAPAAAPKPSATATPGPAGLSPSLPAEPDGIAGATLAWNQDLRLPASGSKPVWFSPASGSAQPIGGLPASRAGYRFTRVGGGWAVQTASTQTGCAGCAGSPGPVWFLADGAHAVTRLGTADAVAASATAGKVWLVTYPPGAELVTASGTAREAGTTGPPGPPLRLPAGYLIDQGTSRGLLLTPSGEQPGGTGKLWDPATGRVSQSFTRVLAAGPDAIAWATPCSSRCGLRVLGLATGHHTTLTLPPGSSPVSAAFSPDGRYLAVQDSFGVAGDGGELAMQLEVAPLATGRLSAVPGTWVSSDALVGYGWPGAGDSLVAEFGFTTKMQLASWDPGATRPAVALLRPGPEEGALILG